MSLKPSPAGVRYGIRKGTWPHTAGVSTLMNYGLFICRSCTSRPPSHMLCWSSSSSEGSRCLELVMGSGTSSPQSGRSSQMPRWAYAFVHTFRVESAREGCRKKRQNWSIMLSPSQAPIDLGTGCTQEILFIVFFFLGGGSPPERPPYGAQEGMRYYGDVHVEQSSSSLP